MGRRSKRKIQSQTAAKREAEVHRANSAQEEHRIEVSLDIFALSIDQTSLSSLPRR